jgi:hypothetical protein
MPKKITVVEEFTISDADWGKLLAALVAEDWNAIGRYASGYEIDYHTLLAELKKDLAKAEKKVTQPDPNLTKALNYLLKDTPYGK